ncbi:DUF4913 domain-containing protein [Streptomyces fungicidicus]|uniref:DUF4913 domain-containing protein n=1 Tax=Streptomyces fungicidicus TaxID=68203 RepID=UPI0036C8F1A7
MSEEPSDETLTSRLHDYLEGDAEPEPEERLLVFTSLLEFVDDYIAQVMAFPDGGAPLAWCPTWWLHAEAVVRFSVMWRAFEYLKTDPALGLSVWWRDHADPHMRMLRDPATGPFAACQRAGSHIAPSPLPTAAPPDGLFDSPEFSVAASDATERSVTEEIRNSPRPWLGWIALTLPTLDEGTAG